MKILKFLLGVFVVAMVAAFLFNYPGSQDANKQAGFCINCHEMMPHYYTWTVSSHNKFSCLKCHEDIKITTFAYKHVINAIPNPIVKKDIVSNQVCEDCHTGKRQVSPPGDIIFPHQLHVVKKIDCVDCHNKVAHLNVTNHIKNTKNFSIETFNEASAKKLIVKNNQVLMQDCLRCHNGDMATNKCLACHRDNGKEGQTTGSPQ